MPAERLPMRCVREILRLKHSCGATDRIIARSTGLARSTVSDYLDRAISAGLGWPLPPTLTEAALEAMLFARAGIAPGTRRKAEPDWPAIHRELRRGGVTLMMLWQRYRTQNPKAYGYSQFCELYRGWESRLSSTMRQVHPAPTNAPSYSNPSSRTSTVWGVSAPLTHQSRACPQHDTGIKGRTVFLEHSG
jgi:hypothetical protein